MKKTDEVNNKIDIKMKNNRTMNGDEVKIDIKQKNGSERNSRI